MDTERLQQIYDDAGRPGVQAFRFAVRRAGGTINEVEAKAFVAKQSTGQIFAGRVPSDGTISGGGREDMRFQIDLIDFSRRIRKLSGQHRYVLVAVDNYNRQVFTQPMQSKSAQETLEAFRKIIRANGNIMPKEITADLGNEFALLEQEISSKGGVLRRKNMQTINTLGIIDRAIGKLKVILSGYSLTDWSGALKKATEAYNEKSHSYLMGSAPDDVKGSALLRYQLDLQNGLDTKHNNDKWRAKAAKLRDAGAYRTPLPRDTWERIDAPKFGGEVFNVDGFKGSHVLSPDSTNPVKTALAVPAGSLGVDIDIGVGPGGGRRAMQREMLQDFARNLKDMVTSSGLTLARVTQILRGMRGFIDTADVYGPAKAGRIVSFLKLYPNLFEIRGSGPSIQVFEKASVPRPVVQVGGASGSSGPRAERAIEVDRRAPYRRIPNEQRLRYKADNPKRAGTAAYRRYEAYKSATDAGMARRLGATPMDFKLDAEKGYVTLL